MANRLPSIKFVLLIETMLYRSWIMGGKAYERNRGKTQYQEV